MMNKKIADLLNNQINQEFYSAYLYLDIANFYTKIGWICKLVSNTGARGTGPCYAGV